MPKVIANIVAIIITTNATIPDAIFRHPKAFFSMLFII